MTWFQSNTFPPFWNWILNLLFWTDFRKVDCQKSRRRGILLRTLIKFQRDLISLVEILCSSRFRYDIVPKYVDFALLSVGRFLNMNFLVQLNRYETAPYFFYQTKTWHACWFICFYLKKMYWHDMEKWLTIMNLFSDFSCRLDFQMATNQKRELSFRKSEIWHIIDLVTSQQAIVFIPGVHANQTFINVCPICWNQQYRVETCTAVLPQYIEWTVRPYLLFSFGTFNSYCLVWAEIECASCSVQTVHKPIWTSSAKQKTGTKSLLS